MTAGAHPQGETFSNYAWTKDGRKNVGVPKIDGDGGGKMEGGGVEGIGRKERGLLLVKGSSEIDLKEV